MVLPGKVVWTTWVENGGTFDSVRVFGNSGRHNMVDFVYYSTLRDRFTPDTIF